MISQVQHKVPTWVRFVRYCYAKPSRLAVLKNGVAVHTVMSKYGSQQGDPIGGHLFALAIYDFMALVARHVPQAAISWIVDDLTVSGTMLELQQVATLIQVWVVQAAA